MQITNEIEARRFVAAWNGHVRSGVLAATIDGLEMSASVMGGAPQRYTAEERADNAAALVYLKSVDDKRAEEL